MPAPRRAALAAVGPLVTVLAGCTGSAGAPAGSAAPPVAAAVVATHGSPLWVPVDVPPATLTATDGSPYDLDEQVRRPGRAVTVVTVAYVHCPNLCQSGLADLATALRHSAPQVRRAVAVVVVTADPERDTPAALRRWLDRYDRGFEGLTGPPERVRAVAAALGAPVAGRRRLPAGGYHVGHAAHLLPFSAEGVATTAWEPGTSPADLRADLAALVAAAK